MSDEPCFKPWFRPHGVLDPERHMQLIANRTSVARDAGIPIHLLWQKLPPALTAAERAWLAGFHRHRAEGRCGLLLTGEAPALDPLQRIGALAGCLSRNFVRARVVPLLDALEAVAAGAPIAATCLLIPDFVPERAAVREAPAWRVAQLTALLTARWSASGLQTVLYAPSLADAGREYGGFVADLLRNHYLEVAI
ncbi:MAG: hypothetical protein LCH93_06965 [Proteobacteria bacterium]|nr:hypothetical protein [Pseudomonadota bacterium]